jgi:hypothetical protein
MISIDKKTKICPYCSESILDTAKKCRHCGEFLAAVPGRTSDYQWTLSRIVLLAIGVVALAIGFAMMVIKR